MKMQFAYERELSTGRLTDDPAQRAVLPELDRVLLGLVEPAKRGFFAKKPVPVKGLYMWGGVGRGKSMLMDLLFEEVTVSKERWHFHAFMQWVHAEMTEVRKTGVDDAIKPVAEKLSGRLRFLAFDEMQITDITDAMIVGRLFEGLFDAGVVIVTTSNRHPTDLYKDGLNRQLFVPFIDLIGEKLVIHELVSDKDYRQGRLSGAATYFSPLGLAATAALDQIWSDLTAGQEQELKLQVKGRVVTIPRFHNGVARCTFLELCGKPLGAGDYLKLAQSVRVLMLDDIPQLSRDNSNEAKRFVTLIDALYEGKIKLICSAAADPEALYLTGEGTFEFERTASRLREMQAQNWANES